MHATSNPSSTYRPTYQKPMDGKTAYANSLQAGKGKPGDKFDKLGKGEKMDKFDKLGKGEKMDKCDKLDKGEKMDKFDELDKGEPKKLDAKQWADKFGPAGTKEWATKSMMKLPG